MHLMWLTVLLCIPFGQNKPAAPITQQPCLKLHTWDAGKKMNGCQFSPDSKHFACMVDVDDKEAKLVVWNVQSDKPVHSWQMPHRAFPEFRFLNMKSQEELNFVQFISSNQIVVTAVREVNKADFIFYVTVADLENKAIKHHEFKLTTPFSLSWCAFHFATHAPVVVAYISHPDKSPPDTSQQSGYWQRVNLLSGLVEKNGYLESTFPKHYGFGLPQLPPDGNWMLITTNRHGFSDGSGRLPVGLLYHLMTEQQIGEVLFSSASRGSDNITAMFSPDGKHVSWQEFDRIQLIELSDLKKINEWKAPKITSLPDGTMPPRRFVPLNGISRVIEYTSPHSFRSAIEPGRKPIGPGDSGNDQHGVPTGWSLWRSGTKEAEILPLHWWFGLSTCSISPDGKYLAQMKFHKDGKHLIHFDVFQLNP